MMDFQTRSDLMDICHRLIDAQQEMIVATTKREFLAIGMKTNRLTEEIHNLVRAAMEEEKELRG